MRSSIFLFLGILILLISCRGQKSTEKILSKVSNELSMIGDTVASLGNNIMVIYQDKSNTYWFGSWDSGVYRYDGSSLINYTTKDGLINNRIDEIKEDKSGNLYFASANAKQMIGKFDGKRFTTLSAVFSEDWKLEPADLWFKYSYGNERKVYRYDGITLYELQLPNPPNLPNPFDVYSIYQDKEENIWFGTNPVGVCRYDGQSFQWITEFRDEGANGVRSITEDKNGDFWFNTEFRYSVYDSITLGSKNLYTRHKSIGGLDGKKDSNLDEYLSIVMDDNDNLWFVTYLDGVWKYDGHTVTQYLIKEDNQDISLFSIYKDNFGDLWVGSHENGVYKFNGESFERFDP